MIEYTRQVHVSAEIADYIAAISEATRGRAELRLGASTRASLALLRAAQAWAAGDGRRFVTPDDIKTVAEPVLAHRLVLEPEAELDGARPATVLAEVLRSVAVPAPVRR